MALVRTLAGFLILSLAAPAQEEAPKYPPGLYAIINTSAGAITAQLFEAEVPNTVRTFFGLARGTQPWLDPKTHKQVNRPLCIKTSFSTGSFPIS